MALSKSVKNTDSLSHRRINDHSDLYGMCVDFCCFFISLYFLSSMWWGTSNKIKNNIKTATRTNLKDNFQVKHKQQRRAKKKNVRKNI